MLILISVEISRVASFLAKSLSYALRERASHTLFICIIIFNLVSVLFCPFFPTWCLVCDVSIPRLSVVASDLVKTRIVRESDYSAFHVMRKPKCAFHVMRKPKCGNNF